MPIFMIIDQTNLKFIDFISTSISLYVEKINYSSYFELHFNYRKRKLHHQYRSSFTTKKLINLNILFAKL